MLFYRSRILWCKIFDKCSSPDVTFSRIARAMKVPCVVKMPIHSLHQPVDHVASPVTTRMIV
ncbi:hypothetical protein H206_05636 [Candidatus Electrothrix aarhusensis]|uniref:Uncharacterized protein n=1 Tax=Candidatus Electrothrix aarhusensis TaxID=1859131 RepID=A0A3S3QLH4_9BACT|nr:hypothetical protein H206_05636 [Candidatus Electrothrix aarhusensis]